MFFRIHDRIQIPRYIETATVLHTGTNGKAVSKTQPRKNWHSACVEFAIPPRSWLAPWVLSSDTNGHPSLGVKQFKKKKEATGFLRRFGFELILRRSDCDVWETKEEPKVRALMFQNRDGLYLVGQLRWRQCG
jgi:hypothetical protein